MLETAFGVEEEGDMMWRGSKKRTGQKKALPRNFENFLLSYD
jgi:hypothetical protein